MPCGDGNWRMGHPRYLSIIVPRGLRVYVYSIQETIAGDEGHTGKADNYLDNNHLNNH